MLKETLRLAKKIINRILLPLRIEIKRTPLEFLDLTCYEESIRPESPVYVNIGAGRFYHPLWHNLDHPNEYYSDSQKEHLHVQYDLRSHLPLPFKSNSLKVVYTSHVIEHIRNCDVEYIFKEVYRCLKPGGYFRITCPDIDLEYEAYIRGDEAFWKWANAYGENNETIGQKFLDHFATALTEKHPYKDCKKYSDLEIGNIMKNMPKEAALNYFIGQIPLETQKDYHGDHINWFNKDKIISMLNRASFTNVYESKYAQSKCPVLRDRNLFDSTCPELSLYIECQK